MKQTTLDIWGDGEARRELKILPQNINVGLMNIIKQ
jgi:hypothetical protein